MTNNSLKRRQSMGDKGAKAKNKSSKQKQAKQVKK